MLRRRPPPTTGSPCDGDGPLQKQHDNGTKRKNISIRAEVRALASTLSVAVQAAVNPAADVRSHAYSEYLTTEVYKLTIGWHIFRAVTEGAFLAAHGFAFNTLVVQIFWSISVGSVLLYCFARPLWLRCREWLCVWANVTYGLITVLKIFHLVDRLPNENHYMFKHCFLTMADAACCQTAVHRQYVIQFLEAVIRVVVWRRYNVLADTPTWGVVCISLAWQVWLFTFSCMLQVRHVSAFMRQHSAGAASAASDAGAPGTSGSTISTSPAAATEDSEGGGAAGAAASAPASRPGSCELEAPAAPAPQTRAPVAATTATSAAVAAPPVTAAGRAAATAVPGGGSGFTTGRNDGAPAAAAVGAGAGLEGAAVPAPSGPMDRPMGISSPAQQGGAPSQKRFMRALRGVARGPSSYVLLSHQRRQAGSPKSATAQFYIPTANPDVLSGNWRERLTTAIAEGAPGWQVANVCVRKGSLIVHLDLVYVPAGSATSAAAEAAAHCAAAAPGAVADGSDVALPALGNFGAFSGASYSEKPFEMSSRYDPKAALDDLMGGLGAESLLEMLGLSSDLAPGEGDGAEEEGQGHGEGAGLPVPISVQLGDRVRELPLVAWGAAATATAEDDAVEAAIEAAADAAAAAVAAAAVETKAPLVATASVGAAAACTASTASKPEPQGHEPPAPAPVVAPPAAWQRLVVQPVRTALWPPAELRSREYCVFLSGRVGALHTAYASVICLTSVALFGVRPRAEINPLTLLLFISAEILSVAAALGLAPATWRVARCGLAFAGVALRTLQMAACTCGFLPHLLRDSDCVSGRWIQKVVLITTLQALCMQPPVRAFFMVRMPSVLLSIHVHVYVCQLGCTLLKGLVLHGTWEALLFLISANFQCRHLEAFRRLKQQLQRQEAAQPCFGCHDKQRLLAGATAAGETAATAPPPPLHAVSCRGADQVGAEAEEAAATAAGSPSPVNTSSGVSNEVVGAAPHHEEEGEAREERVAAAAGCAATAFRPVAAPSDPTDVSVSAPVVGMAPRRAALLKLHFTCAPAIVDELQVVLRHINPAAMASGVHVAHAVRDIAHALVTPAGATAAPPTSRALFCAELTLVASPADMPGLVHVELWRGRRRVCSQPVLLAVAPVAAPPPPTAASVASVGCGLSDLGTDGDCASAAESCLSTWLDDVRAYVGGLREEGHGSAAEQFVEELGGWLAATAALERGLADSAAATGAAAGSAARVANVLYFHGLGSDFMYLKPRRVSGGGAGGATATGGGGDRSQNPLRQMLLSQGSMLLAVAAEAGCVALSAHLHGLMVGSLGTTVGGLLEAARTPVTQLPLLHAAVKSGEARMVDLVAEWSTAAGLKDIWAQEAAVLAVALESCASGAMGDSAADLEGPTGAGAVPGGEAAAPAAAAAAAAAHSQQRGTYRLSPLSQDRKSIPRGLVQMRASDSTCGVSDSSHRSITAACTGSVATTVDLQQQQHQRVGAALVAALGTTTCAGARGSNGPYGEIGAGADLDLDLGLNLYDSDGDLTDESPFKIIDFRARNRAGEPTAAEAAAGGGGGGSVSCGTAGGSSARSNGRGSFDGLADDGVLVLTPLHMSLALGDGGTLASHILRTYPEAYELWRTSKLQLEVDPSSASEALAADSSARLDSCCDAANRSPAAPETLAATLAATAPSPVCSFSSSSNISSSSGLKALMASAAAATSAYGSLPGLTSRRRADSSQMRGGGGGGGGGGGLVADDSLDCSSLRSLSLSEVAFFEGMRWVDDEAPKRRPGFKVTRM